MIARPVDRRQMQCQRGRAYDQQASALKEVGNNRHAASLTCSGKAIRPPPRADGNVVKIFLNDEYDKKLPLGVFYRYLYQS